MRNRTIVTGLTLVVVGSCFLAGCGGGGVDAPGQGSFRVTFNFPKAPAGAVHPAVIFNDTLSITIDLLDPITKAPIKNRVVVDRPPAGGQVTTNISPITAGTWLLVVKGWSAQSGQGTMVSKVSDSVTINTGQTASKNLVMAACATGLVPSLVTNPVLVDGTATAVVTPVDVSGATVLGDFQYEWSSDNEAVAAIKGAAGASGTQDYVGVAPGTVTLRVKLIAVTPPDPDQGVLETWMDLTVNPNVDQVVVVPNTMNLAPGEYQDATATAMYKGVVVPGLDFTFSVDDAVAVVLLTKTGQNTCTVGGGGWGGGTNTISVTQPYNNVKGTISVTVPVGGLDLVVE